MKEKIKKRLLILICILAAVTFLMPDYILAKFLPALLILKYAPYVGFAALFLYLVLNLPKSKKE